MHGTMDILLVEDNPGDVALARRALGRVMPQVRVAVAGNGTEALDFLNKAGPYEGAVTPDLILLDINMPRMDGKQLLEIVKASEIHSAIPVVMFTSSESPQDVRDCFARHANGYVVKPFDGKDYADALQKVVSFWSSVGQLPN
jgi:CheY-like chemotaxis protein